jgi:hypothetical protein
MAVPNKEGHFTFTSSPVFRLASRDRLPRPPAAAALVLLHARLYESLVATAWIVLSLNRG